MVRLLLIRHAATEASGNNKLLGSTDAAATDEGLLKLRRLHFVLDGYSPGFWFCSPMLRARQTAKKLQEFCLIEEQFQTDDRLQEIDFGRWEQKSFADIEISDPDLIPAWSQYDEFVFPEGEAVKSFIGRVSSILDELRTGPEKEIGIVTHGGVIRTMICLALGISAKNYLLFAVPPASLTIIDLYPEGGVLAGLNL